MLLIPLMSNVWAILILTGALGAACGVLEASVNIYIIYLWGKEVTPFMQALHFFFGVGALAAPIFTRPFILPIEMSDDHSSKCNFEFDSKETTTETYENVTRTPGHSIEDFTPADLRLIYPYCVITVFSVIIIIWFIIMYWKVPTTPEHPSRAKDKSTESTETPVDITKFSPRTGSLSFNGSIRKRHDSYTSQKLAEKVLNQNLSRNESVSYAVNESTKHSSSNKVSCKSDDLTDQIVTLGNSYLKHDLKDENKTKSSTEAIISSSTSKWYKIENPAKAVVIVLAIAFLHVYYALELTFGSFLTVFSVNSDIKMNSRDGAQVTSVYWAAFTFWRLFTVFYIGFTGPRLGILINLAILGIGVVIMVPFGFTHEWALYAGAILIGVGISPLWGVMFGFLESYFTVTSRICSCMMTSAAIGEFIFPAILAKFMDCQPMVFIYLTLAASVLTIVIFLAIVIVCHYKLTPEPNRISTH